MKKIAILVLIALSISTTGVKVLAAEIPTTETPTISSSSQSVGIEPDSMFYPLEKFYDSVRVFLAVGDEKKAKVLAYIAQHRLAESELMFSKGKNKLAEEVLKDYSSKVETAETKIQSIIDSNKTTTDEKILERINSLQAIIQENANYSIEVLQSLASKADDTEKESIDKLIQDKIQQKESVQAITEKVQQIVKDRQELSIIKADLEKAKQLGDEEAIKELEQTLETKKEAIEKNKEELKTVIENRQENNKQEKEENKEEQQQNR